MMDYFYNLITLLAFLSLLTLSLNIVTGYVRYLNLGHVGFWAFGAYTFAILTLAGVNFITAMLAGGIMAGITGLILGLPTLRLKSHFIAITSLGFLYITYSLIVNLEGLTRGALGIAGIPRPNLFGYSFQDNFSLMLLTLIITAVSGFIIYRVLHSPFGKVLEAIRDDEIATKALGKNTYWYKLQAFILSAFFAGIAGALSASYFNYIGPSGFAVAQEVFFLAALMVGGAGTFWGSVLGTIIIQGIEEISRFIPFTPNVVGPVRAIVYALILISIMLWHPNGIMGKKIKHFERM